MTRPFFLLLLVIVSLFSAAAQSGRRVTTPRSAPAAPIQPPANPEPEPPTVVLAPPSLNFLPDSLRQRSIHALDSSSFRFADFGGKVLVINLWASWCGPCRREVPEYEKVRKTYAGREVEFIGLTTEDPRSSTARVKQFVREVNFTFRLGWADDETARTLMNGKHSIPQTLVIDANGQIVEHWTGYSPGRSGDRLRQTVDHALQIAQQPS